MRIKACENKSFKYKGNEYRNAHGSVEVEDKVAEYLVSNGIAEKATDKSKKEEPAMDASKKVETPKDEAQKEEKKKDHFVEKNTSMASSESKSDAGVKVLKK